MKKRIVSLVLLVSLCAAPLYGIDPVAAAQRAQMIVNQLLQRLNEKMQIANQVTQIRQFTEQLTKTREQILHMKEAALGQIGALEESFAELVAGPTNLVVDTMQWQTEFTGSARELVGAAKRLASGQPLRESWRKILNQIQTNQADIVELLSHLDPQVAARVSDHYLQDREEADNRRVTTYLVDDSATALIETAASARESLQKLRSNSNVSDTALAQAQVTGLATQGELLSAMAQLMAFEAARGTARDYQDELKRRQQWKQWERRQEAGKVLFEKQQADIAASADGLREGLVYRIPSAFGDSH
ncbi:MAG: hypothetical protein OXI69_16590 [Acidobacteriota bacterium]|nr:hypothetical protein [Acidobacteriota bacterium]